VINKGAELMMQWVRTIESGQEQSVR